MNIGIKPIMTVLVALIMVGVVAIPIINDVNVVTYDVEVEKTGIYKTNMEGSYEWYETYTGTRNYATNQTASIDYDVDVTKTGKEYATNQTDSVTYTETTGVGYQVKYIKNYHLTDDTSGTLVHVFDEEYLKNYDLLLNLSGIYTYKESNGEWYKDSSGSLNSLPSLGEFEIKSYSPGGGLALVRFTTVNVGAVVASRPIGTMGTAGIEMPDPSQYSYYDYRGYYRVKNSGADLYFTFAAFGNLTEVAHTEVLYLDGDEECAYSETNSRWEVDGVPLDDSGVWRPGDISYGGTSATVSIGVPLTYEQIVSNISTASGYVAKVSVPSGSTILLSKAYSARADGGVAWTSGNTAPASNIVGATVSSTAVPSDAPSFVTGPYDGAGTYTVDPGYTLAVPVRIFGDKAFLNYFAKIQDTNHAPTTTQVTVSSEYGTMSDGTFTADTAGDYLKVPSKVLSGKTYYIGEDTYYLYNGTAQESNVCPTVSGSWTTGYIPTFSAVTGIADAVTAVYSMTVESPADDLYIIIPKVADYDYTETETRTAVSEYGTMSGTTFTADSGGDYLKIPTQLLDRTYYVSDGSTYHAVLTTSSAVRSLVCPNGISGSESGTEYSIQFSEAQAKDYATSNVYSMSVTGTSQYIAYVIIPKDATYSYSETKGFSVSSVYGNIVDGRFLSDDNGSMLWIPAKMVNQAYAISNGAAYYVCSDWNIDNGTGTLVENAAPSAEGVSENDVPSFSLNAENDQIYDVTWQGAISDNMCAIIPKDATYTYMGTETVTEEGSPLIAIVPVLMLISVVITAMSVWTFRRDYL